MAKAAANAYRCIGSKPAVLNLPKTAKPIVPSQKLRGLQRQLGDLEMARLKPGHFFERQMNDGLSFDSVRSR